jgi:hypothetical protein
MFKEKTTKIAPKKENVAVNMVLAITTHTQILKMWYSRRKNLSKTRDWLIGKKRKSFNIHLKKLLRTYNKRSCQKICMEPIYKL